MRKSPSIIKNRLVGLVSVYQFKLRKEMYLGASAFELCAVTLAMPSTKRAKTFWRQLARHLENTGGRMDGFRCRATPLK